MWWDTLWQGHMQQTPQTRRHQTPARGLLFVAMLHPQQKITEKLTPNTDEHNASISPKKAKKHKKHKKRGLRKTAHDCGLRRLRTKESFPFYVKSVQQYQLCKHAILLRAKRDPNTDFHGIYM